MWNDSHSKCHTLTMGQQDFNLIIDPTDQEINNNHGADPEIMYSDYSTDHLEDLE